MKPTSVIAAAAWVAAGSWAAPAGGAQSAQAAVTADLSGVREGPVRVMPVDNRLRVSWNDEASRPWVADFSLDPSRALVSRIAVNERTVLENLRPVYWIETGKRRGGWDEFFDLPPSHPDGTRRFAGVFRLKAARARTAGDRVEVFFDGLELGTFRGSVAYTFFPESRLIQQEAVVSTTEPDTAFFYDAGIQYAAEADRRPGGNMETRVSYFDTAGKLEEVIAPGPERRPGWVRYRALAAQLPAASVAVFPAPHQYFMPRDFTSNMGPVWSRSWRGQVGLGIRQLPDDNTSFYPWMNAPPGTSQRLSLFLLVSTGRPAAALAEALRYTNGDRFPKLDGHKTLAAHWHFAYTVQAMEKGAAWVPPFKPVLKEMGVDAAMIMDFHGDGHPQDVTELRLKELEAYFRFCRAQSDASFLLIPAEEANAHLGGHYAVVFPKPVYWFMRRAPELEFRSEQAPYGTVYRAADAAEMLEMVRRERGLVYQTHPRTKGSKGYPDKVRETEHFRDGSFFGAGWKAMPADLSTLRQGVRALKLLDDMSNWGFRKRLVGEVDVFQIDSTHELYAHMNVNYVRLPGLPSFDDYGQVLGAIARGDFFISTGEVLLPEARLERVGSRLEVKAEVRWTFPLAAAGIVWGDGHETHSERIPLDRTRAFGGERFQWQVEAPGARWARLEVWDMAGNGALINPVWFEGR